MLDELRGWDIGCFKGDWFPRKCMCVEEDEEALNGRFRGLFITSGKWGKGRNWEIGVGWNRVTLL